MQGPFSPVLAPIFAITNDYSFIIFEIYKVGMLSHQSKFNICSVRIISQMLGRLNLFPPRIAVERLSGKVEKPFPDFRKHWTFSEISQTVCICHFSSKSSRNFAGLKSPRKSKETLRVFSQTLAGTNGRCYKTLPFTKRIHFGSSSS